MRQSALPLTPTLSHEGRGSTLACAAAFLLPSHPLSDAISLDCELAKGVSTGRRTG